MHRDRGNADTIIAVEDCGGSHEGRKSTTGLMSSTGLQTLLLGGEGVVVCTLEVAPIQWERTLFSDSLTVVPDSGWWEGWSSWEIIKKKP